MFSLLSRTITHRRMPSAPCSAACLITSTVAKLSPASWNEVTPFSSDGLHGRVDDLAGVGDALFGRLLRHPGGQRVFGQV